MMQHNLSCWPLVLSISSGRPSLGDLQSYSSSWTEWLNRKERFATLRILLDSSAYGHPPGGAQERKQWFSTNGVRLKEQVLGMATVAPADVVRKMNKIKSNHFLGVSNRAFVSLETALDWLLPQLAAGTANIDDHVLKIRVIDQYKKMTFYHNKKQGAIMQNETK